MKTVTRQGSKHSSYISFYQWSSAKIPQCSCLPAPTYVQLRPDPSPSFLPFPMPVRKARPLECHPEFAEADGVSPLVNQDNAVLQGQHTALQVKHPSPHFILLPCLCYWVLFWRIRAEEL